MPPIPQPTSSTLPISREARREHDREVLTRLGDQPRPVSVAELFKGFRPRWFLEALDRLLASRQVREAAPGMFEVTDIGRRTIAAA